MDAPDSPLPVAWIVDDDNDVRNSLARLLRSMGWSTQEFPSAEHFLAAPAAERSGVLILDVNMPGMTGTELHARLLEDGRSVPIVYLSGRGTVQICATAMKHGATDFLEKPVDEKALMAALQQALERHAAATQAQARQSEVASRFSGLSPRERDVMALVVAGRLNKQIAGDLGIAEKTVKVHRGRVMKKVGVRSVAQLVQLYDALGNTQRG